MSSSPDTFCNGIEKCPTGISGLDEILSGGLPRGRSTLLCGSSGAGKTIIAAEFLSNGIRDFEEPGVFICFEEDPQDIVKNTASLGFNLQEIIDKQKLRFDQIQIDPKEMVISGEYDLDGLFIRLESAIDAVNARRVVLDTIEILFGGFSDITIVRSELHRLFRWLKGKGVTALVTAESGRDTITRHGIEEYVSDCVIVLDQTLSDHVVTRHLRITKYRGSRHGSNLYPFLIDDTGVSVLPVTSVGLDYPVSTECVSTGIAQLDDLLGGAGYYRGSSIMVSGPAGTGKSSIASYMLDATCRRGEKALYLSFEESAAQIIRNMGSIGMDLEQWTAARLLFFNCTRTWAYGLETHLARIHRLIERIQPRVVVIDPVTNFEVIGRLYEVKSIISRLMDYMKSREITVLLTSLATGNSRTDRTQIEISSLIDTWLSVENYVDNYERKRIINIIKSRGMSHSNQAREFLITENGFKLIDVEIGQLGEVLTGRDRITTSSSN